MDEVVQAFYRKQWRPVQGERGEALPTVFVNFTSHLRLKMCEAKCEWRFST